MSRIHDERKDIFSGMREGVLTSSSNIRSIHTISQNMEKEKLEKKSFNQHAFDTGFRTVDLLKPSNKTRSIVPASIGSAQMIHAMPPLLPNYMTNSGHLINPVPINHSSIVRGSLGTGQHAAFQTHIPVGSTISSRLPATQRSNLLSLKPTSQIQLPIGNHITGLSTILPPHVASRPGSTVVATHGLPSDHRLESGLISEHVGVRGNMQATSHPATIQVIASGTVSLPHIPTSFLSKGMNISSATAGMLKINATTHSNLAATPSASVPAFKLGIGKEGYPGSPSILIPTVTSSVTRPTIKDLHANVIPAPFGRFPTGHATLANHHSTTITQTVNSSSIASSESRPHQVGYHPLNTAYVFHDMGHPVSLHTFPHQLIRPPVSSVGATAVPVFTLDSHRTAIPLVSVPIAKTNFASESCEASRSDSLTIQGNFNLHNIYPNIQAANLPSVFTTPVVTIETAVRPSILRKRPADTNVMFPVHVTEKESAAGPVVKEMANNTSVMLPNTRMLSPPILTSEKPREQMNHSIINLAANEIASTMSVTMTTKESATKLNLLTTVTEASPKKKPRKQLIITTEDKYATKPQVNSCPTDDDEEFLKSNETMKDITPPKGSADLTHLADTIISHKMLFPPSTTTVDGGIKSGAPINGLIPPVSEALPSDSVKCYLFRRRPQVTIIADYKVNSKAAHNHFYRASDIKVKEEKLSAIQDRLVSKGSLEAASGWKVRYLSNELNALISIEQEINSELVEWREKIPPPNDESPTSLHNSTGLSGEDAQLRQVHELVQGSLQRCRYSIELLSDSKQTLLKLLEHKSKALDIMKKYKQKPRLKKKGTV